MGNIRSRTCDTSPKCPFCLRNEEVIPIVYGYPSEDTFKKDQEGKIKIGGCMVFKMNSYCKDC